MGNPSLGREPGQVIEPSRLGRWLLAGVLLTTYLPMQVVIAVPFVITLITAQGDITLDNIDRLLNSDALLWVTLLSAALAALLTIIVAVAWPALWERLTSRDVPPAEWMAWRRPRHIPLWLVPVITLPMLVLIGIVVVMEFGPAEIEIQMQLFSTPALQAASLITVSTVVPVAEELIFRGALYNALLPRPRAGTPGWQRHIVPFVVSALMFGAVHLLAGFQTAAALIQIALLSLYLSALRALSGSVKTSIVGHLVWNLTAAIGLIVANMVGTI